MAERYCVNCGCLWANVHSRMKWCPENECQLARARKRAQYIRRYRETHSEEIAKKQLQWNESNREQIKGQTRKYYVANRDRIRERQRQWYSLNHEEQILRKRQYNAHIAQKWELMSQEIQEKIQ